MSFSPRVTKGIHTYTSPQPSSIRVLREIRLIRDSDKNNTFRPSGAYSLCCERLLYTFRTAGAKTSSFCVLQRPLRLQ